MSGDFEKAAPHLVAESETYGWENLTLALQLLLPLGLIALLLAKKRIWIYPYPLLDSYISALCPSFSQQQRLLKWMSSRIPHMNNLPNKITQYWQNGSLLCTLINTVVPGACPNPQKHWKKPPTHGQALAYKYLGVPPILAESEFDQPLLTTHTERKFVKYLLAVQDAINKVTVEEDSLKFTSKYVARGMGLVIGEQNRPSTFYIYSNTGSNIIENILVNIKGPYNTFGAHAISGSKTPENAGTLAKIRSDNAKEQKKLEYKSEAQRSFFRSVSFDIGPIMNLVTNRRHSGEILVTVEMEADRAKITFLPKFSGIYELLLTNDGQHLHGSPFITRIMKNTKDVEDALQLTKFTRSKIEKKIIGKSIDFIDESVDVTNEFCLKLDSNNNGHVNDLKESYECSKSDDESSTYQDSGIFDLNEQHSSRSRQNDLEEIGESEFEEAKKIEQCNISQLIEFDNGLNEEKETIIVHKETPDDIEFLINDSEHQTNANVVGKMSRRTSSVGDESICNIEGSQNGDEEIFDNSILANQEFDTLYNRYSNNVETSKDLELYHKNTAQPSIISTQNINSADFGVLSNIPQFQKGKKITSSIEKIVEIFDSPKKVDKINKSIPEPVIKQEDLTNASPVFKNIAKEATYTPAKLLVNDNVYLDIDIHHYPRETQSKSVKNQKYYLEEGEVYETNVKEIKSMFEKREETDWKKGNLQQSKRKFAKSMPNLVRDVFDKESVKKSYLDDEYLTRVREKRNFWNNLVSKNCSSFDVSAAENINENKMVSNHYENVSQSANALHTLPKVDQLKRKKGELCKTASLDLSPTRDLNKEETHRKITRAESLYDRIRLFDKGFNSDKHDTLLKKAKERLELEAKKSHCDIIKPESLADVPNTTSTNQIEEDMRFAEIMKERFEISKRFFCSLESVPTKPSLSRRHSMDEKAPPSKQAALRRTVSLKVMNVVEKFSLDNIYRDVVLSKMKNSTFRGSPNKEAVVETLSSVSSGENDVDKEKDYVEEEDLNLQFFNIRKRLRKRKSIKSIFDVNY